jgi:hypothetical protein
MRIAAKKAAESGIPEKNKCITCGSGNDQPKSGKEAIRNWVDLGCRIYNDTLILTL